MPLYLNVPFTDREVANLADRGGGALIWNYVIRAVSRCWTAVMNLLGSSTATRISVTSVSATVTGMRSRRSIWVWLLLTRLAVRLSTWTRPVAVKPR
jgi:hypothetical protein